MKERRVKPYFRFADPGRRDGALHWIPDNFPALLGDKHLTLADQLIMRLITARNDLEDPDRSSVARAMIDRVTQALHGFDPGLVKDKHELIATALDLSKMEGPTYSTAWKRNGMEFAVDVGKETVNLNGFIGGIADLDLRARLAESTIRSVLPSAKLPMDVLKRAVELWPNTKQRQARSEAIHALARALGCDKRSLMTLLRQARQRVRDRHRNARRK
jgi:hypothetical protein